MGSDINVARIQTDVLDYRYRSAFQFRGERKKRNFYLVEPILLPAVVIIHLANWRSHSAFSWVKSYSFEFKTISQMVIIRIQLLCTYKFGDRKSKISYSSHSLRPLFPEAQFQEFDARIIFLFIHSSSSDKKRRRRFTSWRWSQVCYRNRKHVARRRQESGGEKKELGSRQTPPPPISPLLTPSDALFLYVFSNAFSIDSSVRRGVSMGTLKERDGGGATPTDSRHSKYENLWPALYQTEEEVDVLLLFQHHNFFFHHFTFLLSLWMGQKSVRSGRKGDEYQSKIYILL